MPSRRFTAGAVALFLALAGTACGSGTTSQPSASPETRTVEIEMVDIAFEPDEITVAKGETVKFRFTNSGKIAHDAFVGDADAQSDHAREMHGGDDGGDMHHGPDRADAVTVDPGQTGTLTYTFAERGLIEIGCHQPGHYEAGMKIAVTVE